MLAQISDGRARWIVGNEDKKVFETWGRLLKQFSLPARARPTNLMNEIIAFKPWLDHVESDPNEFIILKNEVDWMDT